MSDIRSIKAILKESNDDDDNSDNDNNDKNDNNDIYRFSFGRCPTSLVCLLESLELSKCHVSKTNKN